MAGQAVGRESRDADGSWIPGHHTFTNEYIGQIYNNNALAIVLSSCIQWTVNASVAADAVQLLPRRALRALKTYESTK